MMKIHATVLSWQQGRALLRIENSHHCGACKNHTTCSFNPAGKRQQHEIFIEQPLVPGQQIWLNIAASSLLYAGLIVYLIPLSGLILGGAGFQWLFYNDYLTAAGAFTGGAGGFLMARYLSRKYEKQMLHHQRVIDIQLKSPQT